MAKKKKTEREVPEKEVTKKDSRGFIKSLRDETIQGVLAVLSFVLAIFLVLAMDRWDKAGTAGTHIFKWLKFLIGVGYYLLPLMFVAIGISYLRNIHRRFDSSKLIGAGIFLLSTLGVIDIVSSTSGGFIGTWIAYPFVKLFAESASLVFFSAFMIISILIAFNEELDLKSLLTFNKESDDEEEEDEEYEEETTIKLSLPAEEAPVKEKKKKEEKEAPKETKKQNLKVTSGSDDEAGNFIKTTKHEVGKEYTPPPLSLLERDKGKPVVGDVKANANIIKRTLANFGIDVEMDEVSIGPSVTRYAFKPAEGMKLSRIVALQNDLALALAAHPLRIEAPIPGKSLVGIEIPNTTKTTVGLGTLLSTEEYQNSDKPLLVGLGKGISGKSHFANVAKMPHLLIAGATGSGKSVTIHALIVSLLYRNSPQNLKFIMIDPKRVELTLYNKIPHLLTPVITDPKKAILSLKWAAKEMDRRYDLLQSHSVRDIESYHKTVKGENEDPMPFICIIIDELADIMQTYPRELEAGIVRLAQMSRAVGIHLMLSTQRPSVNVITGLIKANIPARLALQVASQVDSRTILDMIGAEKLLGAGDMLYLSGEMSKPTRIQSAYITESEVKKIVKYLADSHVEELNDEINLTDGSVQADNSIFTATLDGEEPGEDDDMYEEAKQVVMEAGKASTSYIQRKLRVGYSRAARLMDLLEERGVIGPADGSKPRSVIGGSADAEEEEDVDNSEKSL